MRQEIIEKYNIPVPRYTSYPPANFFSEQFTSEQYITAVKDSNHLSPSHLSFYIHIPFCRHLCHYCGCNSVAFQNDELQDRYVEALEKEISSLLPLISSERKIAQIHYGGGSPTILSPETLKKINRLFFDKFQLIESPEIAIECHPGYLDESYWYGLKESGFTRLSLGCQDFDEEVLKGVNRKPSLLKIERVVEILNELELPFNLDFIYGLPYQNIEAFKTTIQRAVALAPNRVVTFSYAHVPWINPAMKHLEKLGLPSQDVKKQLFETAQTILLDAGYVQVGIDHFVRPDDELYLAWKQGQLHRNFQGYCTRKTTGQVYAFGVSGISQLANCYAQNGKNVVNYIEQINLGKWNIEKGFILKRKDLYAREIITKLMCNGWVDIQDVANEQACSVDTILEIVAPNMLRAREMMDDQILEIRGYCWNPINEGELFVRNIASIFDAYYTPESNQYSKPI